jgi:hypothetical protein
MSSAGELVELETIVLNKVNQTKKDNITRFVSYIEMKN